jgi:chloramphenicol O-acetyltransferase type A
MKFKQINVSRWSRKEHFQRYLETCPCTYSMTVNFDITNLLSCIKQKNIKLYPTIIFLITTMVNKHEEFRTQIDKKGRVGVFDSMHPLYTVFHKDDETFSNIWTRYNSDFCLFYQDYLLDLQQYGNIKKFLAKSDVPDNVFPISSIPWVSFTGFNLNILRGAENYLLPEITMGKFFEQNDKIMLPMSIQVHHAVCDGFHLSRFINELQEGISNFSV